MGEPGSLTEFDGRRSPKRRPCATALCIVAALAAGLSPTAGRGQVRTPGTAPIGAVPATTPAAAFQEGVAPQHPSGPRIVFSAPSPYGRVLVIDDGSLRILRLGSIDSLDQSYLDLRDPDAVPMEYVRYAALGLAYVPAPKHVLMIGLGGGTFSNLVHRAVLGADIDVVEINPVVVEAAKRYFGVAEDERYEIHIADGAAYVRASGQHYDLMLVDAYSASGIPHHLTTPGFLTQLRQHLDARGVLIANIAVVGEPALSLVATIGRLFPHVACVPCPESGNLLVFGSSAPLAATELVRQRAERMDREHPLPFPLAPLVPAITTCAAP
jgi:spermidine synthase